MRTHKMFSDLFVIISKLQQNHLFKWHRGLRMTRTYIAQAQFFLALVVALVRSSRARNRSHNSNLRWKHLLTSKLISLAVNGSSSSSSGVSSVNCRDWKSGFLSRKCFKARIESSVYLFITQDLVNKETKPLAEYSLKNQKYSAVQNWYFRILLLDK